MLALRVRFADRLFPGAEGRTLEWFLVARLVRDGVAIDRVIKPLGLPGEWHLPKAALSIDCKRGASDRVEFLITTDRFARVVTIEPVGDLPAALTDPARVIEQRDAIEASDNYFDLLADETRTVVLRLHDPARVTGLTVRAWNAEAVSVTI